MDRSFLALFVSFLMKFHEKSVLTVTILLRKVARCILGTRNWVLTLLRRQRKKNFPDQLWEAGLFVLAKFRLGKFRWSKIGKVSCTIVIINHLGRSSSPSTDRCAVNV